MNKLTSWTTISFLCLFCAATAITSPSQTYTTLVRFNGSDGAAPWCGSLVQGFDGNLYGTTVGVPCCSRGTVFKITPTGTLTTLYSFCSLARCTDGANPYAGLVLGTDGNFYGTTVSGGVYNEGTVFKITAEGTLTTLNSFDLIGGANPYSGLVQAADGNFYGTTESGGVYNMGTVFEITPSGTLTILHSFCPRTGCADGANPYAGLVEATDGNLYGTTFEAGAYGYGTIFKITPTGTLTTLHSFDGLPCRNVERTSAGAAHKLLYSAKPTEELVLARNTDSVTLFYSYSHHDDALRGQLERHLAILKRSGVIESWYDRNIEAGTDWSKEIDEHINLADVILLLISADFLSSDYCHEIEMKRALERDRAGEARVIPIILRAVDWAGAEFSHLQALPTDGRPVASWSNTDEAFTDVAKGIRKAVESLKTKSALPHSLDFSSRQVTGLLQAAVPSKVPVGHSRDVVAMIAAEKSDGLSEALEADDVYTSRSADVRSQKFTLTVETSRSGPLAIPAVIRLRSPDFEPTEQQVETELSNEPTTPIFTFLVKAKKGGTQLLNVDLLIKNRIAGTRVLRTEAEDVDLPPGGTGAVASSPPPPPDWTVVASLAMTVLAYAEAQRLRSA